MPKDPKDIDINRLIHIAKSKGEEIKFDDIPNKDPKIIVLRWAKELGLLPGSVDVNATVLYKAFCNWARRNGVAVTPSKRHFGLLMTKVYPKRKRETDYVYMLNMDPSDD